MLDLYGFLEQQFEIVGVILDYERREKFASFHESLESKAIKIYSFEDLPELNPDVVVVFNYIKIIDVKNINVPLLNIHMGVLPVYRGNNANASALLNGDRNVGYTLHEVSDVLDGGKIFYKFTYEIQQSQTYLLHSCHQRNHKKTCNSPHFDFKSIRNRWNLFRERFVFKLE